MAVNRLIKHCVSVLGLGLVVLLSLCTSVVTGRKILVFGGNGFLGSSTVERFIGSGDDVTLVSRGNWYWDSKTRILPHVKHISCDRSSNVSKCHALSKYLDSVEHFDAVIDFSAYGKEAIEEAESVLRGKVALYIFISSDSIYDVCDKDHTGASKETDAIRPDDSDEKELHRQYHRYGHQKLEAEEELMKQRINGGFPFVILRLPDVVGPRDTTYRWWIYQLWLRLAAELDDVVVGVPAFLKSYHMSFVYSEDVAEVIHQLLDLGPQIKDQAINLAYPESTTLESFLEDLASELGISMKATAEIITDQTSKNHIYFYPSVRKGPVDTTKAVNLLSFTPTPWKNTVKATAKFYEDAMSDQRFHTQVNEVLQILSMQLYGREADTTVFFDTIEKLYNVELPHFKAVKDEL